MLRAAVLVLVIGFGPLALAENTTVSEDAAVQQSAAIKRLENRIEQLEALVKPNKDPGQTEPRFFPPTPPPAPGYSPRISVPPSRTLKINRVHPEGQALLPDNPPEISKPKEQRIQIAGQWFDLVPVPSDAVVQGNDEKDEKDNIASPPSPQRYRNFIVYVLRAMRLDEQPITNGSRHVVTKETLEFLEGKIIEVDPNGGVRIK